MMIECCNLTTLSACIVLVLGIYYWYRRPRRFPPGPRGFPILGVIPFLDSYHERILAKWKKNYGSIMSVRFGRQDWIVLNDYEAIQQTLVREGDSFSGRPDIPVLLEATAGHGLAYVDYGKKWKLQRKFGLMTLRGFGMGKKGMEARVLEEAAYMNEEILKQNGKSFAINHILSNTISNVICGVVFGRRFEYDDPWFIGLLQLLEKWYNDPKVNILFGILTLLPWMKYVPPFSGMTKELKDDVDQTIGEFEKEVKQHESTFQKDDIRDFIDAFLNEMHQKKDTFTMLQLLHYIRDLFEAGTETTTSTLRWTLLCLIHYPETQKKLYKEILNVIGEDGKPSMSMKDGMPYTSAFIHEVQRFRTLIPLSVPHCTTNDVNVAGFRIPKGTPVVPNIWAVHNDPNLWDEPEKFKPERHLDADGNFVKSNYVIPFSVGPRYCLGEQLAKIELFLFLTSMVQKFEFLPEEGDLPEIEKGANVGVFTPLKYQIIAKERQM